MTKLTKTRLKLEAIPSVDMVDGLLLRFDRESDLGTCYATSNLTNRQRVYMLPKGKGRKVIAAYIKIT